MPTFITRTPDLAHQLSLLGDQTLPAGAIVNALLRAEPLYVRPEARTFAIKLATDAREKSTDDWVSEALGVFADLPSGKLDIHAVIIALSLVEQEVGWALHDADLLRPLLKEMKPVPPLVNQYRGVWEQITGQVYPGPWAKSRQLAERPITPPTGGAAKIAVPSIALEPLARAVAMHRDAPAEEDQLGRKAFAECIGERLDQVWAEWMEAGGFQGAEADAAYIFHLHGPWGVGKSSVLNFLRAFLARKERLRRTPGATKDVGGLLLNPEHLPRWREVDDRWIVVDFNAWRNQRLRPPWWRLIDTIYSQALSQLDWTRRQILRVRWRLWRARADILPLVITCGFFALAASFAFEGIRSHLWGEGDSTGFDTAVRTLGTVLTTLLAMYAASRSLAFGNARAAQAYTEMRSDPLRPIISLFQQLIGGIRRPVAVFVDDLDRCDRSYVVELLEGIQTLFRSAPVAYVIAADRKWITTSFENCYKEFADSVSDPGRPLGYLFLDKIFQVSASVPRLTDDFRYGYWNALLALHGEREHQSELRIEADAAERADDIIGEAHTSEELNRRIAQADTGDTTLPGVILRQKLRAHAARRISSVAGHQANEHRLIRFTPLLEPNPRAMKRLVNAFGIHQATHFLEGRKVGPDALARWTILELRWPLLAEYLAEHPEAVGHLASGGTSDNAPAILRQLSGRPDVAAVVAGSEPPVPPLDEAAIREILDLPQPARRAPQRQEKPRRGPRQRA